LGQYRNCGLIEEETGRSEDIYKISLEVKNVVWVFQWDVHFRGYFDDFTVLLLCCTFLILREEHRMNAVEKTVLKRAFGPKREEMT
jgi:hypothetical protein